MATPLSGRWINNFSSCIHISVDDNGLITGTYGSDTGSTGTYYLVGYAGPNAPTDSCGQNLAISVFWRSINGGSGDPSWHWVTTQAGQLQNNETINLVQSLVATTNFPGLANVGNYIEKLVYTPTDKGPTDPIPVPPSPTDPQIDNPVNGQWQSEDEGLINLTLSVKNSDYGWLCGELVFSGESIEMLGFTDTYAETEQLQGVTLCGYSAGMAAAIALNGNYNSSNGLLTLSRWLALSTSPANAYVQADLANWNFKLS